MSIKMEIIAVPVIVSLVFMVMEIYKKIIEKYSTYEMLVRLIPVISAILGVAAGIVCYYAFPQLIPAQDIFSAILIGGASGLSATGCNQIFKQLNKYGKDED